jgi:hypothetical protein
MFRMDSPGGENVDAEAAAARVARFAAEREAAAAQKATEERQVRVSRSSYLSPSLFRSF